MLALNCVCECLLFSFIFLNGVCLSFPSLPEKTYWKWGLITYFTWTEVRFRDTTNMKPSNFGFESFWFRGVSFILLLSLFKLHTCITFLEKRITFANVSHFYYSFFFPFHLHYTFASQRSYQPVTRPSHKVVWERARNFKLFIAMRKLICLRSSCTAFTH